ncbi:hypothetical protein DET49_101163 [Salegentibacter sp. 24]|uniref:hypothetical protein n=1 Tax=Salegentibacter sp. 24 TaxID=2183986 RepID=UPI00105D0E9D|nr:hypothetical protein [Salegentibacter sp. 24]TDN95564.1 hypothetical protein DET49_101163 [Salegentibacter sp. 24]
MKKTLFLLLFLAFFTACSPNDINKVNNPNLIDLNFRMQLNLDFPEYNDLQFPGNSYVTYNEGIKGVVVYNINNSQYTAFELSDPNHPPSNCSSMEVEGIIAHCNCEDANSYNIITGELMEGEGQYAMKPYRIEARGNIIEVYN